LRDAPFNVEELEGLEDDPNQDIETIDHLGKGMKRDEQVALSDSIAALSQP